MAPGRESVTLEGEGGGMGRSLLETGVSSGQILMGRRESWVHHKVVLEQPSLSSQLEWAVVVWDHRPHASFSFLRVP